MPIQNDEAIKEMLSACKYMIDESIKNAPFDKTVTGTVVGDAHVGIGPTNYYSVSIYGKTYDLPSYINSNLVPNTVVRVMVPQNNMSQAFIYSILGGQMIGIDNIIHNGYFINPVNQRQATSISPTVGTESFIDRWAFTPGTFTLSNNRLNCQFSNIAEGTYSIVAQNLTKEQKIAIITSPCVFSLDYDIQSLSNCNMYIQLANDTKPEYNDYLWLGGNLTNVSRKISSYFMNPHPTWSVSDNIRINVHFINASPGTYSANINLYKFHMNSGYVPGIEYWTPQYSEELAICQRYFVRKRVYDSSGYNIIGFAQAYTTTEAYCIVPLPVPMAGPIRAELSGQLNGLGSTDHTILFAKANMPGSCGLGIGGNYTITSGQFTSGYMELLQGDAYLDIFGTV